MDNPAPSTVNSSPHPKSGVFLAGEVPGFNFDIEKFGITREELSLLAYPDLYKQSFFNITHYNFISKEDGVIISVAAPHKDNLHLALKTTHKGYEQFVVKTKPKKIEKEGLPGAMQLALQAEYPTSDFSQVTDPKFPVELLTVEQKHPQARNVMKMAVIYAKPGQKTNHEMFSNTACSPGFWNFLEELGKPIDLNGWTHYRGDMRPPGEAWYCIWNDIEIIYHVAPKLNTEERRRLIGNDIPYLIYFDADPNEIQFDPSGLSSFGEVPQIFAIVQPLTASPPYFKVGFCSKSNIPSFNPTAPSEALSQTLTKGFILVKLFNGLTKTIYYPPMQRLFSTPRKATIDELIEKWFEIKKQTMLKRAVKPILRKNNTTKNAILGDELQCLDLLVELLRPDRDDSNPPDWALVTSKVLRGQIEETPANSNTTPANLALFRVSMRTKPPPLPQVPSPSPRPKGLPRGTKPFPSIRTDLNQKENMMKLIGCMHKK